MEPIMRRFAIALGLTVFAAALGCKHIGGKCDCQAHPGDAAPQMITNPHPSAPVISPAPLAIPPANRPAN
jgi:hypothetical protein